jgi:L-alanine-DL-glutamate epimerase-like enolase superfamily enzyme
MKLKFRRAELQLAHRWTIASSVKPGGSGGKTTFGVVFVELLSPDGTLGLGEAAPSTRYDENVDTACAFLERIDPERLSLDDVPGSMTYLGGLSAKDFAPKGALNIALLDGAARRAGKPIHDFLGLGFTEGRHVTSFSIGIDAPDVIRRKVAAAAEYPILKLKVGGPQDRENLQALREAAPEKTVRVDANEGWATREEALRRIEWLAEDGHIEFVEQPMPAETAPGDLAWLKARSPLPIVGDESCLSAADIEACAESYHGVNVKLMKTGGISGAFETLRAARKAGLKTMLGCMIESSLLTTAAAHLAGLTDYLDIDGNLLVTNDPWRGVTSERGVISFREAPEPNGLRVGAREGYPGTGS